MSRVSVPTNAADGPDDFHPSPNPDFHPLPQRITANHYIGSDQGKAQAKIVTRYLKSIPGLTII